MTEYYTEKDFLQAKKQRKNSFLIYAMVFAVYMAISVFLLIKYMRLPYRSEKIATIKWIEYPISVVFVFFSFVYLCIKYRRVNNYYKLCLRMKDGLKETSVATFFKYDENRQEKDGVDVKSLVFLEWNKYKNKYSQRDVFVFYERDFPELKEKQEVRFITQGNMLLSYEIVEEKKEQQ